MSLSGDPVKTAVFIVTAVAALYGAINVVIIRNVVHAALNLVITLAAVAVLYVLLAAEFIAWVQILIYVGAIVVLFLFGIMLTHAPIGKSPALTNRLMIGPGLVAAALFAGILFYALAKHLGDGGTISLANSRVGIADLGADLMSSWVIPFEAVSVVLLAALIGGLVIARKD
jgi:NADH-quinone oxidoreductase subunit J